MAKANARRAGVEHLTTFSHLEVTEIVPPPGPPGLVIINPPYGDRLGDKQRLAITYRALGQTLLSRFSGWRVGLVTSEPTLAKATALPFGPTEGTVAHGGLRVTLFKTGRLP
jgi:putative N6-adenine-specific DNA methylase